MKTNYDKRYTNNHYHEDAGQVVQNKVNLCITHCGSALMHGGHFSDEQRGYILETLAEFYKNCEDHAAAEVEKCVVQCGLMAALNMPADFKSASAC